MSANDYVIGLGGNVGDSRGILVRAVEACGALGRVAAVSALFETEPVGPPQQRYLNAALRLESLREPEELLLGLLAIEACEGRVRRERWGPRTLDLDILWMRGRAYRSAALVIPHPRLRERAFALVPLLEVVPDARDPAQGDAYAELVHGLDLSVVRRLDREWVDRQRRATGRFGSTPSRP